MNKSVFIGLYLLITIILLVSLISYKIAVLLTILGFGFLVIDYIKKSGKNDNDGMS